MVLIRLLNSKHERRNREPKTGLADLVEGRAECPDPGIRDLRWIQTLVVPGGHVRLQFAILADPAAAQWRSSYFHHHP